MAPPDLPANVRVISELRADDPGFDISDTSFVAALATAEDRHAWFAARNEYIVDRFAGLGVRPPAEVLELGCGGGVVAQCLSDSGYRVIGVDGHRDLVCRAAARTPAAEFVVADLSLGAPPLDGRRFDVVGLFDVIEHLDDPAAALVLALDLVRPGGLVVGTVPALMALWSDIDAKSGHRLRYERRNLRALLDQLPGSEIVEVDYFNRALVPLLWLQRRAINRPSSGNAVAANLKPPRPVANNVLLGMLRGELKVRWLLDRTALPGASLWFCIRRRATR